MDMCPFKPLFLKGHIRKLVGHLKLEYRIYSNKRRGTHDVYWKLDATNNCFNYDIFICYIKLTELMSFDFRYIGAVAPRAMAHGVAYSTAVRI